MEQSSDNSLFDLDCWLSAINSPITPTRLDDTLRLHETLLRYPSFVRSTIDDLFARIIPKQGWGEPLSVDTAEGRGAREQSSIQSDELIRTTQVFPLDSVLASISGEGDACAIEGGITVSDIHKLEHVHRWSSSVGLNPSDVFKLLSVWQGLQRIMPDNIASEINEPLRSATKSATETYLRRCHDVCKALAQAGVGKEFDTAISAFARMEHCLLTDFSFFNRNQLESVHESLVQMYEVRESWRTNLAETLKSNDRSLRAALLQANWERVDHEFSVSDYSPEYIRFFRWLGIGDTHTSLGTALKFSGQTPVEPRIITGNYTPHEVEIYRHQGLRGVHESLRITRSYACRASILLRHLLPLQPLQPSDDSQTSLTRSPEYRVAPVPYLSEYSSYQGHPPYPAFDPIPESERIAQQASERFWRIINSHDASEISLPPLPLDAYRDYQYASADDDLYSACEGEQHVPINSVDEILCYLPYVVDLCSPEGLFLRVIDKKSSFVNLHADFCPCPNAFSLKMAINIWLPICVTGLLARDEARMLTVVETAVEKLRTIAPHLTRCANDEWSLVCDAFDEAWNQHHPLLLAHVCHLVADAGTEFDWKNTQDSAAYLRNVYLDDGRLMGKRLIESPLNIICREVAQEVGDKLPAAFSVEEYYRKVGLIVDADFNLVIPYRIPADLASGWRNNGWDAEYDKLHRDAWRKTERDIGTRAWTICRDILREEDYAKDPKHKFNGGNFRVFIFGGKKSSDNIKKVLISRRVLLRCAEKLKYESKGMNRFAWRFGFVREDEDTYEAGQRVQAADTSGFGQLLNFVGLGRKDLEQATPTGCFDEELKWLATFEK